METLGLAMHDFQIVREIPSSIPVAYFFNFFYNFLEPPIDKEYISMVVSIARDATMIEPVKMIRFLTESERYLSKRSSDSTTCNGRNNWKTISIVNWKNLKTFPTGIERETSRRLSKSCIAHQWKRGFKQLKKHTWRSLICGYLGGSNW